MSDRRTACARKQSRSGLFFGGGVSNAAFTALTTAAASESSGFEPEDRLQRNAAATQTRSGGVRVSPFGSTATTRAGYPGRQDESEDA